jgi:hypothetical protein
LIQIKSARPPTLKDAAGIDRYGCGIVGIFGCHTPSTGGYAMLRYLLAGLAAVVLVSASLIPDEALARRGGGVGVRGGGGFHGGAAHVRGGARYGAVGRGYAGRGYGYGRPVARAAVRGGVYRGVAAGAVAAGAYGYYRGGYGSGCYHDEYGQWICPKY